MSKGIVSIWVLVSLWLCLPYRVAHADDRALERFREEAPVAWRRIRQRYSGKEFVGKVEKTDTMVVDGRAAPVVVANVQSKLMIARLDDNIRVRVDTKARKAVGDGEDRALGKSVHRQGTDIVNRKYKASIDGGDRPSLLSYQKPDRDARMELDRRMMPSLRLSNGLLDRSIVGLPDSESVDGVGDYQVTDAKEFIDPTGRELVKLSLKAVMMEGGEFVAISRFVGHAVLNPTRDWSLVEFQGESENEGSLPDSSELAVAVYSSDETDCHPVSIEERISWSDGFVMKTKEEFTRLESTDLSIEDCYLSAFGLPEPTNGRRTLFVLVSILAIVAVILQLRRRKGRI